VKVSVKMSVGSPNMSAVSVEDVLEILEFK
jgi:hypothetical protein